MVETDRTWGRMTRIWWSLAWRGLLFGCVAGLVAGFIVGFLGHMFGLDDEIGRLLAGCVAGIVSIPVGVWVVKVVLGKKFKDFRIALVALPEP